MAENKTEVVFVVVRYGNVVGVYRKMDDAVSIVSQSVAKGQICDLIPKPVL